MLLANFNSQFVNYHGNLPEAFKLLRMGEKRNDPKLDPLTLAAYAMTASLMLNLDEVITRQ